MSWSLKPLHDPFVRKCILLDLSMAYSIKRIPTNPKIRDSSNYRVIDPAIPSFPIYGSRVIALDYADKEWIIIEAGRFAFKLRTDNTRSIAILVNGTYASVNSYDFAVCDAITRDDVVSANLREAVPNANMRTNSERSLCKFSKRTGGELNGDDCVCRTDADNSTSHIDNSRDRAIINNYR